MESEPGIFCFDVFDMGDDLLAFLVRPPDDVSWFWLSGVFIPGGVSYQVTGDVIFLSSLDLSIFFGVRVLCRHHVCHVAGELAPGYFNGSRHASVCLGECSCVTTLQGRLANKSLEALVRSSG